MADPVRGKGNDEGAIVHLVSATVDPKMSAEFTRRLTDSMRDVAAALPGFIEGRILQADDHSRIVAMTHWESRDAWAKAQWDAAIGRAVTESYQSSIKLEMIMCYQQFVVSHAGPNTAQKEQPV
jgi:heme-degrading monooxygenase HmoA